MPQPPTGQQEIGLAPCPQELLQRQAVVVEEVKKQTEELKEANRGLKPMLIITLAVTLANAALFILQILGILGV